MKTSMRIKPHREQPESKLGMEIWQARYLYLMLIPFFIWLIMFDYVPMAGNILAFKDWKATEGIWGSPWAGWKHFKRIFATPDAVKAIINTIVLSLQRILFEFPVPIILALITTEMRGRKVKKIYQTVLTFPHFLSWVVVSEILISLFSEAGAINSVLTALGLESVPFLSDSDFFRGMLFVTHNWKEMGWASIIYMATISSIDPGLYEAAEMDGASKLRQMWSITLPALLPLISMRLILKVGAIMNAGFGQILTMRNSVVSKDVQILDTYIYDRTFNALPNYGFSTAVGLFKGVINFALLMIANQVVGKLTGEKMWSFEKRRKNRGKKNG